MQALCITSEATPLHEGRYLLCCCLKNWGKDYQAFQVTLHERMLTCRAVLAANFSLPRNSLCGICNCSSNRRKMPIKVLHQPFCTLLKLRLEVFACIDTLSIPQLFTQTSKRVFKSPSIPTTSLHEVSKCVTCKGKPTQRSSSIAALLNGGSLLFML